MSQVEINDLRPRDYFTQDDAGSQTEFSFSFQLLEEKDLRVAIDSMLLTEDAFTISISGEEGGTVTLNTAPPPKSQISIWREMAFERVTEFAPGSDLRASVLNDEFDRTMLLLQQMEALVGDSIHRQPQDPDIKLTLPSVGERAGHFLSFDAEGKPEATQARILGDIQNLALVYSGSFSTGDAPTLRLNGTPLQDGDLYFDTDEAVLKIRADAEWVTAAAPEADYLPLDGTTEMQGNLDLGGHNLVNIGQIDGQDIVDLDTRLEQLENSQGSLQLLPLNNAWELARLDGLTAYALANTYIDQFSDEVGISSGTPTQIPADEGTVFGDMSGGGGLAAAFDANSDQTIAESASTGSQATAYIGKAFSEPKFLSGAAITAPSDGDLAGAQANTCTIHLYAANSLPSDATDGVHILTLGSVSNGEFGASVEDTAIVSNTAYSHFWFVLDAGGNAEYNVAEVTFFERVSPSFGHSYDATGDFYSNLPTKDTTSSAKDLWFGKLGAFSHGGTAEEDITGTTTGSIRMVHPMSGDFDFEWEMSNVATDRTWYFGVAPMSEWDNFDKNAKLGGLPSYHGGPTETVENGVVLATHGNRTDIFEVEGNGINVISNTLPGAVNGDVFRISRAGTTFTAHVNDTLLGTYTFSTSEDIFLILGSDGASEYYHNVSWTGYPWADVVPDMASNTDQGVTITGDYDRNTGGHDNNYKAFDGEDGQVEGDDNGFLLIDLGTGNASEVLGYTVKVFGESQSRWPTGFTLEGSNDGSSFTLLDTQTAVSWNDEERKSFPISSPGSYRYYRWTQTSHSGVFGQIREIELLKSNAVAEDMTLVSNTVTADAIPATVRTWMDIENLSNATAGTDFFLEVSRDDGETWTRPTLTPLTIEQGSREIFGALADLAGEPEGTALRIRLITQNLKGLKLHRWAVQADEILSI